MTTKKDLTKVTIVTILGLFIFVISLFWLKGYKLHGFEKIQVYFEDISGLEEGAIVRWSGLRVGVVENIKPILNNHKEKKSALLENEKAQIVSLEKKELEEAQKLEEKLKETKDKSELQKLALKIQELKEVAEVHKGQVSAIDEQKLKQRKSHVELDIVITKKDVPFGPLSRVSIVPSGLIGEHYVEISPVISKKSYVTKFDSYFLTQEPLRFERFFKANIESSEAFKEAITKINQLIQEEDVVLLRETVKDAREVVKDVNKLIDNASVLLVTTGKKLEELATSSNLLSTSIVQVGENINKIIGDEQVRENLKSTTSSLNLITEEVAKLLDEQGLAKDVLEISQSAKQSTSELSNFLRELRQTNQELDLPRTISNLNSLSEKLDKLTTELNSVVADEQFKEDLKVTVQKARETSENLKRMSDKVGKRFLLFRLLF